MKTHSTTFRTALLVCLGIGATAGFAACGDNAADTTSSSTTGGVEPVTSSSSSGNPGTGGAGPGSSSVSSGGQGGAGGGGPDCFTGKPVQQADFLNACTKADCVPFTTPLPLLKPDGSLPPLP
jgi:hypothetical protein